MFAHCKNMLMYREILTTVKTPQNFYLKFFYIFINFTQNRDHGCMLEPPCLGGSNEYP